MGLEQLSQLELLQYVLIIVFVGIALASGVKIIIRYFKYKVRILLTFGLTWIFLSSAWWGSAIIFFLILSNLPLIYEFDLLIEHVFLPVGLILWTYSFCEVSYPHLKKTLLPLIIILGTLYEVLLLYFLLTDPAVIGRQTGEYETTKTIFTQSFTAIILAVFIITGVIFSMKSLQTNDLRIVWKGRFLLVAFVSMAIGAVLNLIWDFNILPKNAITLVIIRIFLIVSSIFYYLGFHLPEGLARRLIKELK
ncbi:MAG: hypothetical protein EU539_08715 [Promethearchaeota archaeon]|nr:MAG: hypothetical protein EU539_08715 [Candidatus Lokiarchaeota archaeon]